MNIVKTITAYFFTACLMLAVPLTSVAYEVNVLTGAGSESKALDKGQYSVAIKRLEQRLQHDTSDTDIQLTNLCTAYVATSQLEKATPVCDQAVEANGDFVGAAYNSRGVLHSLKGNFIAALVDFEKAAGRANYPRPRSDFGENRPENRRFGTPEVDLNSSIEIAARNHVEADRVWAVRQAEESKQLTAGVK